jgi:hypothetical protein
MLYKIERCAVRERWVRTKASTSPYVPGVNEPVDLALDVATVNWRSCHSRPPSSAVQVLIGALVAKLVIN